MKDLRELNLRLTKQSLKEGITRDILIIQSIHTIDELISMINKMFAILKERYGYYAPKLSRTEDLNFLLKSVYSKTKEDMAIAMTDSDLNSIIEIASETEKLNALRISQEKYLENLMSEQCPNLSRVAGFLIGARLVDHAGSFKHLAELPSSTIQILGAEKALFRHLKTGAKAPKFGVIFAHQDISKETVNKGKVARKLASEISKAVKIDYFRK